MVTYCSESKPKVTEKNVPDTQLSDLILKQCIGQTPICQYSSVTSFFSYLNLPQSEADQPLVVTLQHLSEGLSILVPQQPLTHAHHTHITTQVLVSVLYRTYF